MRKPVLARSFFPGAVVAPVERLLPGPRNDIRGAIRQTEKYLAIFRLVIAGTGPSLAPASLTSAQEAGEAGFNFIVFGDMPYRMPGDLKKPDRQSRHRGNRVFLPCWGREERPCEPLDRLLPGDPVLFRQL